MEPVRRRGPSWVMVRRESTITAAGALVVVVALLVPFEHRAIGFTIALMCLALGALVARHRAPLIALALALGAVLAAPEEPFLMLPALLIIYRAGLDRTWPTIGLAVMVGTAAVALTILCWGSGASDDGTVMLLSRAVVQGSAAAALGLYLGARRAQIRTLQARNEQLASERHLLTERAVTEERLRIARELHDVVAHNVSLMVVQAQALGMTTTDAGVSGATGVIADLGRDAIGEMDRTLRLLRITGESAAREPQPGLDQLPPLLERTRQAGIDVELVVEGEPRNLSQSADLSAFRIVQEALTNVLKHAGGAATTVTLTYSPDRVELRIVNHHGAAASSLSAPAAQDRPGHGLTGMRERAALFGGTLTAAPVGDRGFEVRASLPDGQRSW